MRQAVEPLRDAAWGQGFPVFAGEGEPRLGHPAPHCERSSWAFRCVRKTATVAGSRATVRSFFSLVGRLSPPENRRVRSPGHEAETATRRRRWRLACPTWRSGTCSGGCPMPRSQQVFDDRYTGGRTALPGRKVRRSTCHRNWCATSLNELACWNMLSVSCVARTANCAKRYAPPIRKLCNNLTWNLECSGASEHGIFLAWKPLSGTATGRCPVVGLGRDGALWNRRRDDVPDHRQHPPLTVICPPRVISPAARTGRSCLTFGGTRVPAPRPGPPRARPGGSNWLWTDLTAI